MELRDLKAFVAVAEEEHFRRAAERLFVSQPPLSQRIMALEKELGVTLLERTTRRVELTAAGRVFLDHARAILDATGYAADAARRAAQGHVGRIELGYIHSTSYTLLPELLKACRQKLPGLEIRLRDLAVEGVLDSLLDKRIELALTRLPMHHPRIDTLTLVDEPMVLAIPQDHALASRKRAVQLADLADERLIGYPSGPEGALHTIISRLFAEARLSPRFVHVAGTLHTALGLVRGGEGIALVPRSLQAMRLDGVHYRPLAGPSTHALLGLAWRIDRKSPAADAFTAMARALR